MACRRGAGSTEHSLGSIKEPGSAVMKIELLEGGRGLLEAVPQAWKFVLL